MQRELFHHHNDRKISQMPDDICLSTTSTKIILILFVNKNIVVVLNLEFCGFARESKETADQ
jgi:hypothetical protein